MQISGRDKKVLTGGAVAVVLLLGIAYWDVLIPSGGGTEKDIEIKKKLLLQSRDSARQEDVYKARLEQYRQRLRQDQSRLLSGDNPTIAGAELLKVVADLAAQHQVDVVRKDVLREQKVDYNLVKISVRIEANCGPEQLVALLASIQNHEKFLTLTELTINTLRVQKQFVIRPMLAVAGFLLVPEAKPAEEKPPSGG